MKTWANAIDLFCGAGGMSYGLVAAGVHVVAGIDVDPACKYPFETNTKATFIQQDIRDVKGSALAKLFPRDGLPRMLVGCAPCQPFSRYSNGKPKDENKWRLLSEFGRIIGELLPELVSMENVPQLRRRGSGVFRAFVSSLRRYGYEVDYKIIDCSRVGVPQRRDRLVLVASRAGKVRLDELHNGRCRTVADAIRHLPRIAAGEVSAKDPMHRSSRLTRLNLKRIRASKPGGTWRDWPNTIRLACHKRASGAGYPSIYGRMRWNEPSPTMTTLCYGIGNGRFGHPEQDRAISLREAALLQSFPRSYRFIPKGQTGNMRDIGRLIGNAVPPKLAEWVGGELRRHSINCGGRRPSRRTKERS